MTEMPSLESLRLAAGTGEAGVAVWATDQGSTSRLDAHPGCYPVDADTHVFVGPGWGRCFADFVDSLQSTERRGFVAASIGGGRLPKPWSCVDLDTMLLRTQTPWLDVILRGGMTAHFQPIVDLTQGDTVAHEALARGHHRELTLSGGDLMSAALAHGRGHDFDKRAREVALSVASRSSLGSLGLFLNVLPGGFGAVAPEMEALGVSIDEGGLRRERVVLELIETGEPADDPLLAEIAHAARMEGIKVALDDVGSGNNTLGQIERVRPDYVKFDRALCPTMPTLADVSLLVGMVDYAHSKGAVVVAEGIETEAQHRMVTDCGSDMAQGYFYGRPAPVGELEVPGKAL